MDKRSIAIIGIGKIARDQHIPVIGKSDRFELAATVSQRGIAEASLPVFRSAAELYREMPEIDIVAICTPPGPRHLLVREALDAGKHVLMEKPPTQTLSEFEDLVRHGEARGLVLFQTWHSQYNDAVERTREILAEEGVRSVRIDWRESVRKWHPGQDWVWAPGGFGVCDPGINALSIFTRIMPMPVFVEHAQMAVPANRQTPVDVEIGFRTADAHGPALSAHFNWLEEDGEVWTIAIETGTGRQLSLERGGTVLKIDGETRVAAPSEEYERIYERFAELLDTGRSDVDGTPLRLLADAFMMAERVEAEPFDW
ncbi:Gfo/Idh/MocA family oxidoreductase [Arsenicitalea aurantiaca]|uniref:Gfo/Idh/MocA family oxidoreductase n=1 Tax=Arsenicitalea aurantiaca TaxID=1783274 RepID=A0A433X8A8_9HYPH|nr:Gfo/Idh/MocA family oxidoreductase [Arsenicitalea aurantiaca]RUT30280.1 Gfo/Idh/MocA family oxidoreductase [Arsenicitalea aurantiaca]